MRATLRYKCAGLLSVDDVVLVEGFQCQEDRRRVKLGRLFFEPAQVGQVKEEFAAVAVVEYEVQLFAVCKRILHSNYKGMLNVLENAALRLGVLYLFFLSDHLLLKHFHSVEFFSFAMSNQHDLPISASAEDLEHAKVLYSGSIFVLTF